MAKARKARRRVTHSNSEEQRAEAIKVLIEILDRFLGVLDEGDINEATRLYDKAVVLHSQSTLKRTRRQTLSDGRHVEHATYMDGGTATKVSQPDGHERLVVITPTTSARPSPDPDPQELLREALDFAAQIVGKREPARAKVNALRRRLAGLGALTSQVPKVIAGDDNAGQEQALTANERLVMKAMDSFDPSSLVTILRVIEAMDASERLSDHPVRHVIRRFIDLGLAERPEGDRGGVRLTPRGRRLPSKITG